MRKQLVLVVAVLLVLAALFLVLMPVEHGDGMSEMQLSGCVLDCEQDIPLESVRITFYPVGSGIETEDAIVTLSGNKGTFSLVCTMGWWYEAKGLYLLTDRVCNVAPFTLRFEKEGFQVKNEIFDNRTFELARNRSATPEIDVGMVKMVSSEE